ncbi:MAG: hypothetical protein HUU16_13440, partial [Candidatus Omnitrophica bacterium]|nr:hypothetical protein [Candidatus Omnitrophota bacterium]
QRVDTDGDGVIEAGETAWRHVEVNSHRPGALGAELGKRAYLYASGSSTTPSSTTDFIGVERVEQFPRSPRSSSVRLK